MADESSRSDLRIVGSNYITVGMPNDRRPLHNMQTDSNFDFFQTVGIIPSPNESSSHNFSSEFSSSSSGESPMPEPSSIQQLSHPIADLKSEPRLVLAEYKHQIRGVGFISSLFSPSDSKKIVRHLENYLINNTPLPENLTQLRFGARLKNILRIHNIDIKALNHLLGSLQRSNDAPQP